MMDRARKKREGFKVRFLPFETSVEARAGTSLLQATRKADLPLRATCGGKGTCGDCLVRILSGEFTRRKSSALREKLSSRNYALACQTEVRDNLTVELPQFEEISIRGVADFRFFEEQKDSISGFYELDSALKKIDIHLPSPSLDDNSSDLRRLERELHKKIALDSVHCEYSVLKKLARTVRKDRGKVSVVLFVSGKEATVIDVLAQSSAKKPFGIACDIGTSTVALHLINLESGKIASTSSSLNQQIMCGEDVISRINYAQKAGGLKKLHHLIISTINHLIEKSSRQAGIETSDIYYASFAGNTTMTHLFLGLEPRYIREEPYIPTLHRVPCLQSSDLKLKINAEGRITCSPAVGSYVGGDITAGLLSTPLLRDSKKTSLFIDVGTNGELVIGNKDWLISCACSAGPAFEGGGIRCGMPASEGAIEELKILRNGGLTYKVIGSSKPKGLCGSGLVDLLAELFTHGFIDRYGKYDEKKANHRIVESEGGKGFLVEEDRKSFWGKDLIITENDISNLIRTKAAIFSACSLLLKNVGLGFDKIDAFYIAGGFGEHLNVENAVRIGLLPDLDRARFHYLGNTSLFGAHLICLSEKNRQFVDDISGKMTYVELNTEPQYMNEYTGSLFLPHTDLDLFPSVKRILK